MLLCGFALSLSYNYWFQLSVTLRILLLPDDIETQGFQDLSKTYSDPLLYLLGRMQGMSPDVVTYTTLMKALIKAKQLDQVRTYEPILVQYSTCESDLYAKCSQ